MSESSAGRDDELTRAFREGDDDAFRDVLERLLPVVGRRVSARFGHLLGGADFDDAMAMAMVRVWKSRSRFDPARSSLSTWFYLIARSSVFDVLRRQRRLEHGELDLAVWPEPRQEAEAVSSDPVRARLRVRLDAILDRLPENDRTILLTFAEHAGEGEWAQTAAERTGLSVANVRVRKMRLLERLRIELESSAPASRIAFEPEPERTMMGAEQWELGPANSRGDSSEAEVRQEYVARLHESPRFDENLGLLQEAIESIRKIDEEVAAAEQDAPARLMGRIWKDAEERGALQDEANVAALRHTWAWNKAVHDVARNYREKVGEFAARCRNDEIIARSALFRDPSPRIAERLERGVIGLASAITRHMPAAVREQEGGKAHVIWTDVGGSLDGVCYWSGAEPFDAFRLQPEARSSMRQYAEVPEAVGNALADRLMRALRDQSFALPEYTCHAQSESESVLVWSPVQVKPNWEIGPPPVPEHEELDWIAPVLVDAWLSTKPERADELEEFLLGGFVEMSERAAGIAPVADVVVRAIQTLTSATSMEAGRLVLSLLERRFDRSCAASDCAEHARAIDFLAAQLS
jgi:RNA polymerase sigma-70 factor (ECF subfamily)